MNNDLLFVLLEIGSIPFAILILKLMFKKSVIFKLSLIVLSVVYFGAIGTYFVGKYGLIHMTWVLPLVFIFGTLIFLYLKKLIALPLQKLSNDINKLSKGNLSVGIKSSQSTDEIGIINNSIKELTDQLNIIIVNITDSVNNLEISSDQLSSSSIELSQGATEQAASLEQVSATIEELAATLETSTANSLKTEKVTEDTNNLINEVAGKSETTLKSNKQIAEKISIINEIAEVTDILAINASIQAANAGEFGKAFSVVANEVRKLAERSKIASEEIVNLTDQGLTLSNETGNIILNAKPKMENTLKLVQEITNSGNEQLLSVTQVNNAVLELNNVTQQNAASSEELAASAEELSAQAKNLSDTVAFFKTNSIK